MLGTTTEIADQNAIPNSGMVVVILERNILLRLTSKKYSNKTLKTLKM